jgi:hypothetical protein
VTTPAAPLFKTWAVPAPILSATQQGAPSGGAVDFPPSIRVNLYRGTIAVDGFGNCIPIDGDEAWRQWCVLTANTQQNRYPIYRRSFGPDLASGWSRVDPAAQVQWWSRTIERALLADPRTRSVVITEAAIDAKTVTGVAVATGYDVQTYDWSGYDEAVLLSSGASDELVALLIVATSVRGRVARFAVAV